MTAEELAAGSEFLRAYGLADGDRARQLALWENFSSGPDPMRAAWIVRAIRSGGANARVREAGSAPLRSLAPLLPDRWFVIGEAGGRVAFEAIASPIPHDLAFSPDLSADGNAADDLKIDPAVRWMFEFEAAVDVGMAVEIALPHDAEDGIDALYVLGLRTRDVDRPEEELEPAAAARALDRLMASRHYDWGAGIVPQGTATNNTSDVVAGWSALDIDRAGLFQREVAEGESDPAAATNDADDDAALRPAGRLVGAREDEKAYRRLERALGLGPGSVLRRFEFREADERGAMEAMNALLWPVTWGEVLGTLTRGPDSAFFGDATLSKLREWFCGRVVGGASLPVIRFGETPYGILPVEKFAARPMTAARSDAGTLLDELTAVLRTLLVEWRAASARVLRLGEAPIRSLGPAEPGERLIEILRQDAHPAAFAQRLAQDQRGIISFRYELRNYGVHPDYNSVLLQEALDLKADGTPGDLTGLLENVVEEAGLGRYDAWPGSFSSARHQLDVLRDKRLIVETLRDWRFDPDSVSAADPGLAVVAAAAGEALEQFVREHRSAYDDLVGFLDEMIEDVKEHASRNYLLDQALSVPASLYAGIVGAQTTDPKLSFLTYDEEPVRWKAAHHVEVEAGADTVTTAAYFAYLRALAVSLRDDADAPAPPAFPDGRQPLLYQLLRDSILRTAADETAAGAQLRDLTAAFDALARFGDEDAVHAALPGEDPAVAAYETAWRLAPRLRRTVQALAGVPIDEAADGASRLDAARKVLRVVFGNAFHATCPIRVAGTEIADGLSRSEARLARTPGAPHIWLERVGYVRPAIRDLSDALTVQDCMPGAAGGLDLAVGQWPDDGVAPWIAVSQPGGRGGASLSILSGAPAGLPPGWSSGHFGGLVVDEVIDRIPAGEIDTGVALHFDAPNTAAPQSLLLALAPEGEDWSFDTMLDTVRDTFVLARCRAVDSAVMSDFNQVLPAVFAGSGLAPGKGT